MFSNLIFSDVVQGYDSPSDYVGAPGAGKYQGATVGRVCNRIAGGCYTCPESGKKIQLECNENGLIDRM